MRLAASGLRLATRRRSPGTCAEAYAERSRAFATNPVAAAIAVAGLRGLVDVGAQAQLVGQHLQAHQALDASQKLHLVDRLGQKIVGASLKAAHPVFHLVERGDHDDRNVFGARIDLEFARRLDAIHDRHADIR